MIMTRDPDEVRFAIVSEAEAWIGRGPIQEWRQLEWSGLWILKVYHLMNVALNKHWHPGFSLPSVLGGVIPLTSARIGDYGVTCRAPHHHVLLVPGLETIAGNTGFHPGVVGRDVVRGEYLWYSIDKELAC
jgi:hypothetical protein